MSTYLPNVMMGLLGWSNKRTGLEFYKWDPKIIPRHGSEWGDLLVNAFDRDVEGCPVVVIVLPRQMDEGIVKRVVEGALSAAAGAEEAT